VFQLKLRLALDTAQATGLFWWLETFKIKSPKYPFVDKDGCKDAFYRLSALDWQQSASTIYLHQCRGMHGHRSVDFHHHIL